MRAALGPTAGLLGDDLGVRVPVPVPLVSRGLGDGIAGEARETVSRPPAVSRFLEDGDAGDAAAVRPPRWGLTAAPCSCGAAPTTAPIHASESSKPPGDPARVGDPSREPLREAVRFISRSLVGDASREAVRFISRRSPSARASW